MKQWLTTSIPLKLLHIYIYIHIDTTNIRAKTRFSYGLERVYLLLVQGLPCLRTSTWDNRNASMGKLFVIT